SSRYTAEISSERIGTMDCGSSTRLISTSWPYRIAPAISLKKPRESASDLKPITNGPLCDFASTPPSSSSSKASSATLSIGVSFSMVLSHAESEACAINCARNDHKRTSTLNGIDSAASGSSSKDGACPHRPLSASGMVFAGANQPALPHDEPAATPL